MTEGSGGLSISREGTPASTIVLTPSSSTSSSTSSTPFNFGRTENGNNLFGSSPGFTGGQGSTATSRSAIAARSTSGSTQNSPSSEQSGGRLSRSSSPAYFSFGEPNTVSLTPPSSVDIHPDEPLSSVEIDAILPSPSARIQSSPDNYTKGTSTPQSSDSQVMVREVVNDLSDLRLASVSERDAPSATRTPLIQLTPTPPVTQRDTIQSPQSREDSIVGGLNALRLGGAAQEETDQASRSPSPGRRRRSRSSLNMNVYSVEDENPPESLFYASDIQNALIRAKSASQRIALALSNSTLHKEPGSRIDNLLRTALNLTKFKPPSSRTVGLVGDSGVGKSSLINSLLDRPDFARASSSGSACTCVVTEYHYHNKEDFIIQIDYFSLTELSTQFDELLRAHREYRRSSGDKMLPEEREDLKKRSELADSTFKACFKSRLTINHAIMNKLSIEDALKTMKQWASELIPADAQRDREVREVYTDARACSQRLQELTSEIEEPGESCPWPFIRKIRVHMKAHILGKGLVIADLPGLRDLNSARQNVTERYVRQCHQIFAVTGIGRAATNVGVRDVFDLGRSAALSNIGVICTMADDIRLNEAMNDWPMEKAYISEMRKKIAEAKHGYEEIQLDIDGFDVHEDLDDEEKEELSQLYQERDSTKKAYKDHEFELKRHLMKLRNSKVTAELRTRYQTPADKEALNIFCVSNTLYWDNRNRSKQAALSTIDLSGIPSVRRYCIGIVADNHLKATVEYIKNEIPALLGSIELWVQAGSGNGSAERKDQILKAVVEVQKELHLLTSPVSDVSDVAEDMKSRFDIQVRDYMREHARQWSAASGEASEEWMGWHHSSYAAWCRNYGTHYTKACRHRCWNSEAVAEMKNGSSNMWDVFIAAAETYNDELKASIRNRFLLAMNEVRNSVTFQNEQLVVMLTLSRTLKHQYHVLKYSMEKCIEEFQAKLRLLQADAFSPVRTSIVGKLLEQTYRSANKEHGTGSDRRKKAIINQAFRSVSLFDNHRNTFRAMFHTLADNLEKKLEEAVAEQVAIIEADLNTLKSDNVIQEHERNPEFRRTLAGSVESVQEEMARISSMVDGVVNTA